MIQRVINSQEATKQLEEKKACLLKQQRRLTRQVKRRYNCDVWRRLNMVNYKLEVIDNRLNGKFFDPLAAFQTVEEVKYDS